MAAREHLLSLGEQRIVVLGARGMFASDFVPRLRQHSNRILLTDIRADASQNIAHLDITSTSALDDYFAAQRPDWVVNCAAYTAVDLAEKEYDKAFLINTQAAANLAHATKRCGAKLLHISTDYVFGSPTLGFSGETQTRLPIAEDHLPAPCGVYGHSKWFGEQLVREINPTKSLIVRTSWLHGIYGPNFIDTMIRLGRERPVLKVVNDQIGSPTWTGWLAEVLIKLMERDVRGVYHASSRGNISWYDFAREIFRQKNMAVEVQTQTTEELNRPAPRPAYSVFDVSKLERTLGETCISWQDCVRHHLAAQAFQASQGSEAAIN